jgi:glycyl-tRNA synthetase beta chain
MSEKDITSIVWPMSRSKNIVGGKETGPVDHSLFREEHEINLYEKLVLAEKKAENLLHTKEYDKFLELMEGFGKTVDAFFDEVLVMDNDEKVRDNRISLLSRVTRLYKGFADFSRIIIDNGIK